MSKAKVYGQQPRYIPNSKADMRHRKKVYQRGREKSGLQREQTVAQTDRRACDGKE